MPNRLGLVVALAVGIFDLEEAWFLCACSSQAESLSIWNNRICVAPSVRAVGILLLVGCEAGCSFILSYGPITYGRGSRAGIPLSGRAGAHDVSRGPGQSHAGLPEGWLGGTDPNGLSSRDNAIRRGAISGLSGVSWGGCDHAHCTISLRSRPRAGGG